MRFLRCSVAWSLLAVFLLATLEECALSAAVLWVVGSGHQSELEQDGIRSSNTSTDLVETLTRPFCGFDINRDGVVEINDLTIWPALPDVNVDASDPLLIVMVERRLLARRDSVFVDRINSWRKALGNDGWRVIVIDASVYSGEIHQDGRTVLAIRRFFQTVHASFPNFRGAVLVGSFPETMLVRRWAWKHSDRSIKFGDTTYNKGSGPKATWLAMDPELISQRSDVVLCDLDGNWEDIYVQPETTVDLIQLLPNADITDAEDGSEWPSADVPIRTDKFRFTPKRYEDFFFIDDADFEIVERSDTELTIRCSYEMRLPEVSESDRKLANPLAVPEIMVSRINPLHIAVSQPASNLDENGFPKSVPGSSGSPNEQFTRDATLERKLLIEYFDRNLAHRAGIHSPESRRAALMTTDLHQPSAGYFATVAKELGGTGLEHFSKSTAVDFVRFMKAPAVIKGVSAHSNATLSILMSGYDQVELEQESGGKYWFWEKSGDQFRPSNNHSAVRDRVTFSLLRTLWQNNTLAETGSCFYIHGGCEAISPTGAATHPYNNTAYCSQGQIAEDLLFYGNGLALVGRAKVFYDIPRGFDKAFGVDHGCVGDVLHQYFAEESNDAKVGRDVAGRNRVYFWSIIGDWTLRLSYPVADPETGNGEERSR